MRRTLVSAIILLAWAASAAGQTSQQTSADVAALKTELERMRADLDSVKNQLAQVRSLLSQGSGRGAIARGPVRANVADAPTLGRSDAPVTIVEFSDYQCPFCRRHSVTTLTSLRNEYIDRGKLRYVLRDYPLEMHPYARKAAEAAYCAGERGKYWEMHDALFQNQAALAGSQLVEYARAVGVDPAEFERCLSSGRHTARVARGLNDGGQIGVQGTPTFIVGKTLPGDTIVGTVIRGAQPFEIFRRAIDLLLTEIAAPSVPRAESP
jgi:protein-disulfide isomerase